MDFLYIECPSDPSHFFGHRMPRNYSDAFVCTSIMNLIFMCVVKVLIKLLQIIRSMWPDDKHTIHIPVLARWFLGGHVQCLLFIIALPLLNQWTSVSKISFAKTLLG